MWCASATLVAVASAKLRRVGEGLAVPMMGVMGAFVFAAQMINFSIPGTGSSGHLGGGILLAALLGPWAALLTITSVLVVQAVFFADGGFLALGCNVFNMGVLPCLVAYPLLAKPWMAAPSSPARTAAALAVTAVVALQLGAFAVVVETWLSGISALPFRQFVLLMQPIHLAIGIVEGLATAAVVLAVRRQGLAAGEMLPPAATVSVNSPHRAVPWRVGSLALAALLMGGGLSWFASSRPDGLEWAMANVAPESALEEQATPVHRRLASAQSVTALLPDYDFAPAGIPEAEAPGEAQEAGSVEAWPNISPGTTVSGIAGGVCVALILAGLGLMLRGRRSAPAGSPMP